MFFLEKETNQYQLWRLRGENSQLTLIPERGGLCSSWIADGQEMLYLDPATLKDPGMNVRGGIPILFPICGPLANDRYTWQGREYQMKQHGLARNLPWQVTGHQLGPTSAKLSIALRAGEKTLSTYPFAFAISYTFELSKDSLSIHQTYKNESGEEMPFSAGFHPYFYAPQRTKVRLETPAERCLNLLTGEAVPISPVLDLAAQGETNLAFRRLTAGQVVFDGLGTGRRVAMQYGPEFSEIVVWSLADRDFVCVEPWTAGNNALNTGEGLLKLGAGETLETWVTMSVKPE